jgi:hypothetical protein
VYDLEELKNTDGGNGVVSSSFSKLVRCILTKEQREAGGVVDDDDDEDDEYVA